MSDFVSVNNLIQKAQEVHKNLGHQIPYNKKEKNTNL